jgi:hypothetical protein
MINTEKLKLNNKTAEKSVRGCDAGASAQTAQGCSDFLHAVEDSRTDNS